MNVNDLLCVGAARCRWSITSRSKKPTRRWAPFHATLSAQVSFESTVAELSSPDPGKRLKAVQMLKAAAYPEAALPLAPLVLDAFATCSSKRSGPS